ncbi:MAG TPA: hypothetical protein VFF06_18865 [Polyangia bacterium]|nr:hypothetical protein [Polyangia bacterium]
MRWFTALSLSLWLGGCQSGAGTTVSMSFDRAQGFYSAPFPSDDLRNADGSINLARYPNPNNVDLINQGIALLNRDKPGFAVMGGIFMQLSAPLDASKLPDVNASVTRDSPIVLMSVDPAAPDYMRQYPIQIAFMADGGSFGAANLLSILPYQGIPLRENTRYAAVVTRRVLDAKGHALGVSPSMAQLASGGRPAGLSDAAFNSYGGALNALAQFGIAPRDIAGLAVFTTGSPTAEMDALVADILARPIPAVDSKPVQTDLFPDYCVYATTIKLPDYQEGNPPYTQSGGGWLFDSNGKPILQRTSQANLVVTIPRTPMPANGYPLVVVVQAGAGGDRALVDRGPQAMTGGPALVPGTGPAMYFARAGFAGTTVDGPLEGLRNITHDNEDFLIFNIQNAEALRDNVRESALELVFFAHVMKTLQFDASDCPGANESAAHFDSAHFGLFGHSMGSWIAPLILANEPLYGAAILSGAGGSYIENVMYKQKPLAVKPLAEIVLDYNMDDRSLTDNDPALTMVQWAVELSDPQVYASRIVREPRPGERPRHVLMEQGIVDHYLLPQIANALSLSLGLDEAGVPLDSMTPELSTQTPLKAVLPLSGHSLIQYPVLGNIGGKTTAVVIQHDGDGVEDGHEVVFQTDPPKHQYRCYLQSWLKGTPSVPPDDTADAPCP